MLSFVLKRLGLLIPTFFGITLITFGLIRMIPGDPVEVMMGERRVDPVMHAEAMHRLGLDKPLPAQYFDYVSSLAQGNFGESLVTRESVWKEFVTLFPATVELATAAMLFAIVVGLLAGVLTWGIYRKRETPIRSCSTRARSWTGSPRVKSSRWAWRPSWAWRYSSSGS